MGRTNLCDIGSDHMVCLSHIWAMGYQKPAKVPGDIGKYGLVKGALPEEMTGLYKDLL